MDIYHRSVSLSAIAIVTLKNLQGLKKDQEKVKNQSRMKTK